MRKSLVFGAVLVLVLGVGAVGYGKYYQVTMPQFAQERLDFCGIAVSQSFISYLTGHAPSQYQIAYNPLMPEIATKATLFYGFNAEDIQNILRWWTGRGFDYHNHNSRTDAEKRIIKELKDQRHALGFPGNACYPNGTPKDPMKHWMMVIMADVSDGKVNGVYVLDPLYGSTIAGSYETVRPYSYMRDLFSKWWLSKNGLRQSVEW